jgi:hypothetical protein
LLGRVFGGSIAGKGLKVYQVYADIAEEHANTNFAPHRARVKRAGELRAREVSDENILQELQGNGATKEHAQAAIDSLGGLKAGGDAQRTLVKRARELREEKASDAEILQDLQANMGATPEHA